MCRTLNSGLISPALRAFFVHTDPDGVPSIACLTSAHPEQRVLKRLQQTRRAKPCLHRICTSRTASGREAELTRRAKHWLHRICTSRTASGQEALSRMLSPC